MPAGRIVPSATCLSNGSQHSRIRSLGIGAVREDDYVFMPEFGAKQRDRDLKQRQQRGEV